MISAEKYEYDLYVLTRLKFSQFYEMDSQSQLDFLAKMDRNDREAANFHPEDFNEDLILCLLRNGVKNAPQIYWIINQRTGLWGDFFYKRPYPKPGVSIEEQYNEPKWLKRAENYEKAVDEIYKIVQKGEEEIYSIQKFLGNRSSMKFVYFLRAILRPEVGHPLKDLDLRAIKREDFLPFKIDNGFRAVKGDLNNVNYGGSAYTHKRIPANQDFDENQKFYVLLVRFFL